MLRPRVGYRSPTARRAKAIHIATRSREALSYKKQKNETTGPEYYLCKVKYTGAKIWLKYRTFFFRLRDKLQREIDASHSKFLNKMTNRLVTKSSFFIEKRAFLRDAERSFGPLLEQVRPTVILSSSPASLYVACQYYNRQSAANKPFLVHDFRNISVPNKSSWIIRLSSIFDSHFKLNKLINKIDGSITCSEQMQTAIISTFKPKNQVLSRLDISEENVGSLELGSADYFQVGRKFIICMDLFSRQDEVYAMLELLSFLPDYEIIIPSLSRNSAKARDEIRRFAGRIQVNQKIHFLSLADLMGVNLDSSTFYGFSVRGAAEPGYYECHYLGYKMLAAGIPCIMPAGNLNRFNSIFLENAKLLKYNNTEHFLEIVADLELRSEQNKNTLPAKQKLDSPDVFLSEHTGLIDFFTSITGSKPENLTKNLLGPLTTSLQITAGMPRTATPVVGFGPANFAGQAWEWAKALERSSTKISTEVLTIDGGSPLKYPTDIRISRENWLKDRTWQSEFSEKVQENWSHVLLEAGRPLFGYSNGRSFSGDAELLRNSGLKVGLILHGSESRDPFAHSQREKWSPFSDPSSALTQRLQDLTNSLLPEIRAFNGTVFFSTPDMLCDLPFGTWLPVVIDVESWHCKTPILVNKVPKVLHTPSNQALKGTNFVLDALTPLANQGKIELIIRDHVPPAEMRALVKEADIILDQFSMGIYGVMAMEAVTAGKLVISHVSQQVRDFVFTNTGLNLPILEANPETLASCVANVLHDKTEALDLVRQGHEFVAQVHDGRKSAQILSDFLIN